LPRCRPTTSVRVVIIVRFRFEADTDGLSTTQIPGNNPSVSTAPSAKSGKNMPSSPSAKAVNPFIPFCMQSLSPLCESPQEGFPSPRSRHTLFVSTYLTIFLILYRVHDTARTLSPMSKMLMASEGLEFFDSESFGKERLEMSSTKSPIKKIDASRIGSSSFRTSEVELIIHSVPNNSISFIRKLRPGRGHAAARYTPPKTVQIQRFNSYVFNEHGTIQLLDKTGEGVWLEGGFTRRKVCCNCKKSHCLKLYCECFSTKTFCDSCNCVDCYNNTMHYEERDIVIKSIEDKHNDAFVPKIARSITSSVTYRHKI